MNASRTQSIAKCAVLVALLIVSCFFTIPLGPVPFTMQTAVVILIALLCTPAEAAAATGVYLIMGTVGLPVFSGMTGGIMRPSGGFIISYVVGSVAASALRGQMERMGLNCGAGRIFADVVTAACIIVVSDIIGWIWLMFFNNLDAYSAFLAADAPYIAIDCVKAVVTVGVAQAVRLALPKPRPARKTAGKHSAAVNQRRNADRVEQSVEEGTH